MHLARFARPAFLIGLAAPASASTWIVDDTPGPGVDFATIAAAEAASVAGDVILVRAGNYAGFGVDVGVSILGDPGATITGLVYINSVPQGPRMTLAGFATHGIAVQACDAPVLLEDLVVSATNETQLTVLYAVVLIMNNVDVRLRGIDVTTSVLGSYNQPVHGIWTQSGRVELSQCTVNAAHGISCINGGFGDVPGRGGSGVVANGASLRIGGSSTRGGDGGSSQPGPGICSMFDPNDAGAGLRIMSASDVIVSGLRTHTIVGGLQGVGNNCLEDGEPGNGVFVELSSALRFSGATPIGQSYSPGCGGSVADIVGPYLQPAVPDPILTFTGAAQPGGSVTYTLHGQPGARARLSVGRQLVVVDVPNADEDRLLVPLRTYDLGFLPATGTASFTVHLGGALPRGMLLVAQGSVESPGGALALTTSMPTTLR